MEVPALAVSGTTPVVPPLVLAFAVLAVCGLMLLLLALMKRNLRLVFRHGLNPFRLSSLHRGMDLTLPRLQPGERPFMKTISGRFALGLVGLGVGGLVVTTLVRLFAGHPG